MSVLSKIIIVALVLILILPLSAQDTVSVPDLEGLTPAQATAELNRVGLLLGTIQYEDVVSGDEPQNSIVAQFPQPLTSANSGDTVDITLRYNVLLRYDGNEFHLINMSAIPILLADLTFETDNRSFDASGWGDAVRGQYCVQAWSINISNFHRPRECGTVMGGIGVQSEVLSNQQFWLEDDDSTSFQIYQDGMLRGECPIARDPAEDEPEDTCLLWLASSSPAEDITEYLYFIYDAHNFYVENRSVSQWMPLESIQIKNTRSLVETRFFDSDPIGRIDFLAVGQCLHINDGTPLAEDAQPLSDCDVMAQVSYPAGDRFWLNGFGVDGVLDVDSRRECPPASGDEVSVCLIPR